jgi:hypothetical protein
VDAIGHFNGVSDPLCESYQIKNPLMMKSFGRPGKHEIDEQGRRVFDSIVSGYRACLFDIALKIQGKSRAGLKPESTLENLLGTYGIHGAAATEGVVKYLRKAMNDTALSRQTPLSYFLE